MHARTQTLKNKKKKPSIRMYQLPKPKLKHDTVYAQLNISHHDDHLAC